MPPKGIKKQKKMQKSEVSEESSDDEKHQSTQEKYVLYKLLDVDRKATDADIKSSYRKLVLKVHPDKNKEDPEAKEKFHKLTEAYKILTDPEKRKEYDQTGTIAEQFNQATFQTAYEYYRKIYKKIEKEDIESFSERYRFGQMQKQDLIKFYKEGAGDMIQLLQSIPLSVNQDVARFIKFYEDCFEEKILQSTAKFVKTKNKVRKIVLEQEEVKEELEKIKKKSNNSMDALVMAIQGKKSGFLDALQKKYGQGEVKAKNKKKV